MVVDMFHVRDAGDIALFKKHAGLFIEWMQLWARVGAQI